MKFNKFMLISLLALPLTMASGVETASNKAYFGFPSVSSYFGKTSIPTPKQVNPGLPDQASSGLLTSTTQSLANKLHFKKSFTLNTKKIFDYIAQTSTTTKCITCLGLPIAIMTGFQCYKYWCSKQAEYREILLNHLMADIPQTCKCTTIPVALPITNMLPALKIAFLCVTHPFIQDKKLVQLVEEFYKETTLANRLTKLGQVKRRLFGSM